MRWLRLTTRRIMVMVMVLAVGLWLGIPAVRIASDKGYHTHCSVYDSNGHAALFINSGVRSRFWPRYWRRLLGLPADRLPVCGSGEGRLGEICVFDHPEMEWKDTDGTVWTGSTPAIMASYDRLEKSLSLKYGHPELGRISSVSIMSSP